MPQTAMKYVFLVVSVLFLSACGGGSSSPSSPNPGINNPPPPPPPTSSDEWVVGEFAPSSQFIAQCQSPRSGVDIDGRPWPDSQGTDFDEKMWLRSWSHETYLWYDEIDDVDPEPFDTPQDYFEVLKTTQTTPSGAAKDNFHFFQSTDDYQSFSQAGVQTGYGIDWAFLSASPPRDLRVSVVQPASPAAIANVERGDRLIAIDGADAVNGSQVDFLNQAISPGSAGETYDFTFRKVDGTEFTASLTSQAITATFVNNVQVIDTDAGKVGYLRFDGFQRPAQTPLINGFRQFVNENVTELVLDMRYNGGGLLAMASQLAYMIAGPAQTSGRVFERTIFNDKNPNTNPVTGSESSPTPFYSREIDWERGVLTDITLPSLSLTRVYMITTGSSCSATEALINGLRGIDIEVVQIGSRTCGKPYGFYPTDNCGTTYFTIQLQATNNKGFGEYADGFKPVASPVFDDELPGCIVSDDFTRQLGDQQEGMFAATLTRLGTGSCPVDEVPDVESVEKVNELANGGLDLKVMDPRYRSILTENKVYTPVSDSGE